MTDAARPDPRDTPQDPPGLPLDRLAGFLDAEAPGLLGGALTARVVAGGKSNLTYEVGDGTRIVIVRRPPLGHVLATAHDMGREHRVITALRDTAVGATNRRARSVAGCHHHDE